MNGFCPLCGKLLIRLNQLTLWKQNMLHVAVILVDRKERRMTLKQTHNRLQERNTEKKSIKISIRKAVKRDSDSARNKNERHELAWMVKNFRNKTSLCNLARERSKCRDQQEEKMWDFVRKRISRKWCTCVCGRVGNASRHLLNIW